MASPFVRAGDPRSIGPTFTVVFIATAPHSIHLSGQPSLLARSPGTDFSIARAGEGRKWLLNGSPRLQSENLSDTTIFVRGQWLRLCASVLP